MTDISGQPFGDPGAVCWDDAIFSVEAIFSGQSLPLDVNFYPKISRRPLFSEDDLSATGSKHEQWEASWADFRPSSISESRWRTVSTVVKRMCSKFLLAQRVDLFLLFKVKLVQSISPLIYFICLKTNPVSYTEKGEWLLLVWMLVACLATLLELSSLSPQQGRWLYCNPHWVTMCFCSVL